MSMQENIQRARKEAGMTQKQLADAIGVYQKDISRWEKGERTPSVESIRALCQTLKVSADDILEIRL